MTTGSYLLILIYSGMAMDALPRTDLGLCLEEARQRMGGEMKVMTWDNMNGSHPIPKVVVAFCVQGATSLE